MIYIMQNRNVDKNKKIENAESAEMLPDFCTNQTVLTAMLIGELLALVLTISAGHWDLNTCLLYTSPSPRDRTRSRMPSSA